MKRILIIFIMIILVSQVFIGCSKENVQIDYENADYDVTISYEPQYDSDIFGDLSNEKIREILSDIMDNVLLDDNIEFVAKTKIDKILNPHQVNADEIIENVLIDYGIDDIEKIDLVKEVMTIKKIKRN
ncbi:MAG: hypothetical protein PWP52_1727 [Bacteroidales bacterium]|nr:hypothetical protein [Bacteroidales bacterium]